MILSVQGIAQLCGRFLFILHCTSLTGCDAIARGFEGIIQVISLSHSERLENAFIIILLV